MVQVQANQVKFIELCAGIGGTRAGLQKLGWSNVLSVEIDHKASQIHREIFGDCLNADLHNLDPVSIPSHDVLVAGFPCQPFSSSGHRTGLEHSQGNVFQGIMEIVRKTVPRVCIFENVQGMFSNKYGHTFGSILQNLTAEGYVVDWCLFNARWVGVPQDRKRLIVVAYRKTNSVDFENDLFGKPLYSDDVPQSSIFSNFLIGQNIRFKDWSQGDLAAEVEARKPKIGSARPKVTTPFKSFGRARENNFFCGDLSDQSGKDFSWKLGNIVSPSFVHNRKIRSARYWGHTGETKIYVKKEGISHSVGTSIGAAPLFFIDNEYIPNSAALEDLLEHSNWYRREESGYIFRLKPHRASLLFGEECDGIESVLRDSKVSETDKYKMIGNMVSPSVAKVIGEIVLKIS